jgi:putative ABC transport system permease protein
MLELKKISKEYKTGDLVQTALDNASLNFRDNEFVAILGSSGSGKTTMLNIIGGLDRYDKGDLLINGVSTKKYKDRDWDTYRNHTIGFVFQSYNLIPHQTILANVELAMTISGISKKERKRRAKEELEKVGLGKQLHKKPNQMSGGQMQRVAIARALVNNPDILLADEPTGALDTETSYQVMEIIKEIAKDRLVIMVTHNPELAQDYATRIVELKDGKIKSDSNSFDVPEEVRAQLKVKQEVSAPITKTKMSFATALSLSLNNLKTKKARTILTAFAGSIGIIGIALILSLSSGIDGYIAKVQSDTLSSYPITIESQTLDYSAIIESQRSQNIDDGEDHDLDKVYSKSVLENSLSMMTAKTESNDLGTFKKYLESDESGISDYVTSIQYGYDLDLHIYSSDTTGGIQKLNPSETENRSGNPLSQFSSNDTFTELLGNEELLKAQYDIVSGAWPKVGSYNEVVIVVNENNEINDTTLYQLGLLPQEEYEEKIKAIKNGEEITSEQVSFNYEDILNTTFKLVPNSDHYQYDESTELWVDMSKNKSYMTNAIDDGLELKVVGIIRPNEEASATSIGGTIGYTSELTQHVINHINESEVAKAQIANPETNIFTGIPFETDEITMEDVETYLHTLPEEQQLQMRGMMASMTEDEILSTFSEKMKDEYEISTYEDNLSLLGVADLDSPSAINIYCKDFSAKDIVADIIKNYNNDKIDEGQEELVINYTDIMGMMMSSITDIINMISYVLIAFVGISLVVSSIMIGIITYISVLERTKEIGILRSIGASKNNVSSVFNAETLIIGFISGSLGIVITLLLNIPVNAIIKSLSGVSGISSLPAGYAIILIAISMFLTFIAGLIPASLAAKKDPVTALRSE